MMFASQSLATAVTIYKSLKTFPQNYCHFHTLPFKSNSKHVKKSSPELSCYPLRVVLILLVFMFYGHIIL